MANLDLDIDMNGMENDILNKSQDFSKDIYPMVVKYARKKGVDERQLNNLMLNIAGKYSNATDEQISQMAEKYCEKEYEKCLKKVKDGTFGDCGTKLEPCKKKFIEDYKKKELRKSKNKSFWTNVLSGVNKFGEYSKDYMTTKSGKNLGEELKDKKKDDFNTDDDNKTEVLILGMKPLVFTFVALGTVITLALVTVMLTRKGTK